MMLKVVDLEEARPIYAERDPKDPSRISALHPGRIRHSLVLELPDGSRTKVQVPASVFEKVVLETSKVPV